MFGFHREEAEKLGSHGRFLKRIQKFRDKGKKFPVLQHYFWWLIHNIVAHTFLAIAPVKWSFQFHDWSSKKLNAE